MTATANLSSPSLSPGVLARMAEMGHEEVVFACDPAVGYKAIIAVHSTLRGAALGGARLWNYESEEEALIDALRLARGMTYKCAAADLPLGGGKAVLIGKPTSGQRAALLRAHGRAVDRLGGRYITAIDIGTSPDDMRYVRETTRHVACLPETIGDPSPVTAHGVVRALRAAVLHATGKKSLTGLTVAVQGCGHVGYNVAREVSEGGARLVVSDVDAERAARAAADFGATVASSDDIFDANADVFAPCARGAILDDKTIPRLRCAVVAGAANNQLLDDSSGEQLAERGITYAPDFIANAGGAIYLCRELFGWSDDRVLAQVERIYDTVLDVLTQAGSSGTLPHKAAEAIAEARLR